MNSSEAIMFWLFALEIEVFDKCFLEVRKVRFSNTLFDLANARLCFTCTLQCNALLLHLVLNSVTKLAVQCHGKVLLIAQWLTAVLDTLIQLIGVRPLPVNDGKVIRSRTPERKRDTILGFLLWETWVNFALEEVFLRMNETDRKISFSLIGVNN